jgi:hypothetical protein
MKLVGGPLFLVGIAALVLLVVIPKPSTNPQTAGTVKGAKVATPQASDKDVCSYLSREEATAFIGSDPGEPSMTPPIAMPNGVTSRACIYGDPGSGNAKIIVNIFYSRSGDVSVIDAAWDRHKNASMSLGAVAPVNGLGREAYSQSEGMYVLTTNGYLMVKSVDEGTIRKFEEEQEIARIVLSRFR